METPTRLRNTFQSLPFRREDRAVDSGSRCSDFFFHSYVRAGSNALENLR